MEKGREGGIMIGLKSAKQFWVLTEQRFMKCIPQFFSSHEFVRISN